MKKGTKQHCEYLRAQAKNRFDRVRGTWCDLLRWGMPHKAWWLLSQTPGERKNQHIVDPTHVLSLRSCVAGFMEGNTSATRPWSRIGTRDSDRNDVYENKVWLQHFTGRVMAYLSASNFYYAAGNFYYDYHTVNTGAHYFEELKGGGFFVHTLMPGSYYVLNDSYGEAMVLVREFALNAHALVDRYGKRDKNGKVMWDNFSPGVKKMYYDANYTTMITCVHIIQQNPDYDYTRPETVGNRKWLELTYELSSAGAIDTGNAQSLNLEVDSGVNDVYLERHTTRRKPFVVGKSTNDFEYGEKGPMLDSLGLVKSLNKKAIGKDQALEQILSPALQGPASLRKSYVSTAPNTFVPLDQKSMAQNHKLESIYQIPQAIGVVVGDVTDMRQQVDKLFFADYLLYLSSNPKTRTAAETNAIVEEQQRVLGPNLQSLNTTYNNPVMEWVMDYVLFEDPYLEKPPESLAGQALKPEYISPFAQAQRAADLPSIDRYVAMVERVAQIAPGIMQKFNTDKLADIYEDRLYLPAGLNNPQNKVDAMRQQAQMEQHRQELLQQSLPSIAGAAKDMASAQSQMQPQQQPQQ